MHPAPRRPELGSVPGEGPGPSPLRDPARDSDEEFAHLDFYEFKISRRTYASST